MTKVETVKELISLAKELPAHYKIIAIFIIALLIGFMCYLGFTKKNSDNFKEAEFEKKSDIKIGDKNIKENNNNEENKKYRKKNSDNFKSAKMKGIVKIEIGDNNGEEK